MSTKTKLPAPLCQTTGRRKAAVARVRIRPGEGKITVNRRAYRATTSPPPPTAWW